MAAVADVTDNDFQSQVLESDQPVLVDFWAPWCGPCRVVGPVVEEVSAERADLKVVKVNVDDSPAVAAQYGVMSIPTLLVVKAGTEVGRVTGAVPKRVLDTQLDEALSR